MLYLKDRSIYDSCGHYRSKYPGTLTQKVIAEKILVKAVCSNCGKEGMAYEDISLKIQKPHICIDCKVKL